MGAGGSLPVGALPSHSSLLTIITPPLQVGKDLEKYETVMKQVEGGGYALTYHHLSSSGGSIWSMGQKYWSGGQTLAGGVNRAQRGRAPNDMLDVQIFLHILVCISACIFARVRRWTMDLQPAVQNIFGPDLNANISHPIPYTLNV